MPAVLRTAIDQQDEGEDTVLIRLALLGGPRLVTCMCPSFSKGHSSRFLMQEGQARPRGSLSLKGGQSVCSFFLFLCVTLHASCLCKAPFNVVGISSDCCC